MCESVRSFLDVSSWSLVTVGIVILIVRLLFLLLFAFQSGPSQSSIPASR